MAPATPSSSGSVVGSSSNKDLGETLKLQNPGPYDGSQGGLQEFITQLRTHHRFFPGKLHQDINKVLHASTCLTGSALAWFEPILRDYLTSDPDDMQNETQRIFTRFSAFEAALRGAFGTVDEARAATQALQGLRQKGSASDYAANFRQTASRTGWDDQPLMTIFYNGLKEEVKDELYKENVPNNLAAYIAMAVRIDDRQHERRKQKTGGKPVVYGYFKPKQNHQANQGRSRHQPKQHSTAWGNTRHSGPMELDAVRDKSREKCHNCGKIGHYQRECKSPRKQRDWKPVPEGKRHLNAANKGRSGYNSPEHNNLSWTGCFDDQCTTHLSDKNNSGWFPREPRTLAMTGRKEGRGGKTTPIERRHRTKEEHVDSLRKLERDAFGNSQRTDKIFREEDEKKRLRNTPRNQLSPEERSRLTGNSTASSSQTIDNVPTRTTSQEYSKDDVFDRIQQRCDNIETLINTIEGLDKGITNLEEEEIPSRQPDEVQEVSSDDTSENSEADSDDSNNPGTADRPYASEPGAPTSLQKAKRKHAEYQRATLLRYEPAPSGGDLTVWIRAISQRKVLGRMDFLPAPNNQDDPRVIPSNRRHQEISWVSCIYHQCPHHFLEKANNGAYPVRPSGYAIQQPYTYEEMQHWKVEMIYEEHSVATLERDESYPYMCQEGTTLAHDCITETCQIHAAYKIRQYTHHQFQATREPPRKKKVIFEKACSKEYPINCLRAGCATHKYQQTDDQARLNRMYKDGFSYVTETGGHPKDREWFQKLKQQADTEEQAAQYLQGSLLTTDEPAILVTCDHCKKKEGFQEIYTRCWHARNNGFNFRTEKGKPVDERWYEEVKQKYSRPCEHDNQDPKGKNRL